MTMPRIAATILAMLGLCGCTGLYGHDEIDRYFQRADSITLSAGDAKETNIVNQTLHPWPPGVTDRRIVANGQRMQRAIERYNTSARPPDPLPPIGLGGLPIGTAATAPAAPAIPTAPASGGN